MFEVSLSENEINQEIEEREEHLLQAYNDGLISQADYWIGIIQINEKLLSRRKFSRYDICPCHLL